MFISNLFPIFVFINFAFINLSKLYFIFSYLTTLGFRRFSNEYDEKEDGEKIGESDPWLANNLPQRCLFNKHFTNGPAVISPTTCLPLAPNDSLMLMVVKSECALYTSYTLYALIR